MSSFPVASSSTSSPPNYDDLDNEDVYVSGAPLTRMVDWECLSVSSLEIEPECCWDNSFHGNINVVDDGFSLSEYLLNGGYTDSDEEGDHLQRPITQHHVQQAIENIAQHADNISNPRWLLSESTVSTSPSTRKIHIRYLPSVSRSSRELSIWRFLNQPHLRRDPWNPAPPVLSIIEREVGLSDSARFARLVEFGLDEDSQKEFEAFIATERLYPLHVNSLETRNDWLDFIRQMLQSLVFLHEHNIAQVKFSSSNDDVSPAIMMDIGLTPQHTKFSRSDYPHPVKYYLVDYSEAVRLEIQEPEFETRRGRPRNVVRLSASRHERFHRSPSPSEINPYDDKPNTRQILFPPDHISPNLSSHKEIRKRNSASRATKPMLDDLSDPETDSGSEAFSSDEEDDSLRRVPSSIRSLAFGLDLKSLAEMLEKAPPPMDLARSLGPLFNSMRQGTCSASVALKVFEECVRP